MEDGKKMKRFYHETNSGFGRLQKETPSFIR
jgi:hypothetical protein